PGGVAAPVRAPLNSARLAARFVPSRLRDRQAPGPWKELWRLPSGSRHDQLLTVRSCLPSARSFPPFPFLEKSDGRMPPLPDECAQRRLLLLLSKLRQSVAIRERQRHHGASDGHQLPAGRQLPSANLLFGKGLGAQTWAYSR